MAVHAGRALFEQAIGDRRGNAQRGVLVWVYDKGTTTLSTLYTDRTKATEADNPISTNGLGNLAIFADPGDYEAHVDSTGAVLYFTVLPDWEDVVTGDEPSAGLPAHLADTVDAHDASAISVVAGGELVGSTVQAALADLADRVGAAGGVSSVDGQTGAVDLSDTYVDTTSAQTVAGTKTHTGAVRNRQGETQFDVLAFGGVSSVNETTATFQAASAEWSANGGGKLNFPANGDHTVNGRIPLPTVQSLNIKHFEVAGNGCILRGATGYAGVVLGDALPADTDAVLLNRMLNIHGFQMFGDGVTAGQEGIRAIGGQNSLVHANKVRGFDINIDVIFCLGAHVAYNEASGGRTYDIVVRAGLTAAGAALWSGATGAGTASNCTRIEKCRSYGDAAVDAQFAVLASDEVEVINCIAEGVAGEVGVLFDALGNTSARYFRVHNLHSENFPSVAVVKAVPSGGRVVVSGLRNDLGALLVDGRGANTTTVFDLDLQSLFSADMFQADAGGGVWYFRNPGSYGRTDPTATALWKGGAKPYIRADRVGNPTQEPGVPDLAAVVQGYGGGKFVAAGGAGVITGTGIPDAALGNNGDTYISNAGGIYQKSGGQWVGVLIGEAVKTADYTLGTGDPDVIAMNLTGANTLTVPPNSTLALPVGTLREVYQMGAGQTTIAAGVGVTIRSNGDKLKIAGQYGSVSLRKRGADEWVAAGDLTT